MTPIEEDFSSRDHALDEQRQAETDGWRPIETAPRDGRDLLLFLHREYGDVMFVAGWWTSRQEWAGDGGERCPFEPTHWTNLPAPPQPIRDEQ